jgi:hypothetical protein
MKNDYKKFAVQMYPSSVSNYYFGNDVKKVPLINKKTKIVSIGSCFAQYIAKYLSNNNYNYIVTEKNEYGFSADWGIVFNSASVRQIFEYSFGSFKPLTSWWKRKEGVMQDPYRRHVAYPKGQEDKKRKQHYAASKRAIKQADVIVITLGLVEVWRDKRDKATFWRVPPLGLYDPDIYEFYVMTVEDVYKDLMRIKMLIDRHNPTCHLIVTVSPVPFQATYREDCDVITANVYSKAVSCVAANKFAKKLDGYNVYYFPSFEFVRYGFGNPFNPDGRHIKKPVVNTMMKFFEKMYVKGK